MSPLRTWLVSEQETTYKGESVLGYKCGNNNVDILNLPLKKCKESLLPWIIFKSENISSIKILSQFHLYFRGFKQDIL